MKPDAAHVNLELLEEEKDVLQALKRKTDEEILTCMRDLRGERALEFQIYASREQSFWVPWTTCLAGTILALTSSPDVVALGLPVILGAFAWKIGLERKKGLDYSLQTLNIRHKWLYNLTTCEKSVVKPFAFDDRILREGRSLSDPAHDDGFQLPCLAIKWTPYLWVFMVVLGAVRFYLGLQRQ